MAREILFKAKRIDNGEWVMGGSIIQFLDDGVRSFYMPQFNEKCICKHDEVTDDILEFQNTRFYKVDGATICQYTGLTDKNGNKIWENDIVSFTHSKLKDVNCDNAFGIPNFQTVKYQRNYVIEFVDTFCTYGLRFRNGSIHFPCKCSTCKMHDVKVIGNIFDNPELLGGADNG